MRASLLVVLAAAGCVQGPAREDRESPQDQVPAGLELTGCELLFVDKDVSRIVELASEPGETETALLDPIRRVLRAELRLSRHGNPADQIELRTVMNDTSGGVIVNADGDRDLDVMCIVSRGRGSCVKRTDSESEIAIPRGTPGWWFEDARLLMTKSTYLRTPRADLPAGTNPAWVYALSIQGRAYTPPLLESAQEVDLRWLFDLATQGEPLYAIQTTSPSHTAYESLRGTLWGSNRIEGKLVGSGTSDASQAPQFAVKHDVGGLERDAYLGLDLRGAQTGPDNAPTAVPMVVCLARGEEAVQGRSVRLGSCVTFRFSDFFQIPQTDPKWWAPDWMIVTTLANWNDRNGGHSVEVDDLAYSVSATYWDP